jgi:hypothetical protein
MVTPIHLDQLTELFAAEARLMKLFALLTRLPQSFG